LQYQHWSNFSPPGFPFHLALIAHRMFPLEFGFHRGSQLDLAPAQRNRKLIAYPAIRNILQDVNALVGDHFQDSTSALGADDDLPFPAIVIAIYPGLTGVLDNVHPIVSLQVDPELLE
jgi:hypothetical protein